MNWHDAAACRHEALHVVAALAVGLPLRGVIRHPNASDLVKLRRLVAAGVRLTPIMDRTTELLADREFRRRVRTLELEMYSRPAMSGAEVVLLLEN
jgi:hypothetical protein